MNNIDELIELNLYEPISRYLTVLEEENDIIKNLTIKILLSLKAVDDVLRYNCNNEPMENIYQDDKYYGKTMLSVLFRYIIYEYRMVIVCYYDFTAYEKCC